MKEQNMYNIRLALTLTGPFYVGAYFSVEKHKDMKLEPGLLHGRPRNFYHPIILQTDQSLSPVSH